MYLTDVLNSLRTKQRILKLLKCLEYFYDNEVKHELDIKDCLEPLLGRLHTKFLADTKK